MTAIVFCGPTLSPAEASAIVPFAVCAGPAASGDVFRASSRGPTAIVLIDGYFDHRLSVWHKEVLWALSQGQRVYGASSMGALRAAELAPFGMVGVGKVFELFESGTLEDDDEVAIVHDEAAHGYKPRSAAMVNIRITLAAARDAGALSSEAEHALITWAKARFYAERSYAELLHAAPSVGLAERDIVALRHYLEETGTVDQKRLDAIAVLERVRDDTARQAPRTTPTFRFEYTNAWDVFRRKALDAGNPRHGSPGDIEPEADDLSGERHWAEWRQRAPQELADRMWVEALERALSLVLADDDEAPGQTELQAESDAFRRVRNLLSQEHALDWMRENDLDIESFSSLMHDEVLVNRRRPLARRLALLQLASVLRAASEYATAKPAVPFTEPVP